MTESMHSFRYFSTLYIGMMTETKGIVSAVLVAVLISFNVIATIYLMPHASKQEAGQRYIYSQNQSNYHPCVHSVHSCSAMHSQTPLYVKIHRDEGHIEMHIDGKREYHNTPRQHLPS